MMRNSSDDDSAADPSSNTAPRRMQLGERPAGKTGSDQGLTSGLELRFADVFRRRSSARPRNFHVGVAVNDGEQQEYIQFESDVFSFMVISPFAHGAFWFAMSIFALQITILSLITVDLLDDDSLVDDGNLFNVPINVDWQVWVAQILAIIVAAVSQDDVRTSLRMISVGYSSDLRKEQPAASYIKFFIANLCRFSAGLMSLVVLFIFIVQADNVIDIFLNVVAVEFISSLGDLGFELASTGYVGRRLRNKAEEIEDIRFPITRPRLSWVGYAGFYLIIMSFFAGWSTVRARQSNGYLLSSTSCATFHVEFGDDIFELPGGVPVNLDDSFRANRNPGRFALDRPPPLLYSFFSGVYEAETDSSGRRFREKNKRPIYFERGENDPSSGRFYYCNDQLAWVFSIPALGEHIPSNTRTGDCEWGWLAISPQTDVFRLEDVGSFEWDIWTGKELSEMEKFSYQCTECKLDRDCNLVNGVCNNEVCDCNDGWGGFSCQVELPYCQSIVWSSFGDSSTAYTESLPLHLFRDGTPDAPLVYDRPVYKSQSNKTFLVNDEDSGACSSGIFEVVVLHTGRRWLVTVWCPEELEAVLDHRFHAFWDNVAGMNTQGVSASTTGDSPTDDLEWVEIVGSGGFGPFGVTKALSNAGFHCLFVDCARIDVCGASGTCQDSQCYCFDWFGGNFCEIRPNDSYSKDHFAQFQEWLEGNFRNGFDVDPSIRFDQQNAYFRRWWEPYMFKVEATLLPVLLEINLDCYPSETGYIVYATRTQEIIADAPVGSFDSAEYEDTLHSKLLLVEPGKNYTVLLEDSYGDGLGFYCTPVFFIYSVTALLQEGDVNLVWSIDGDFGFEVEFTFVVGTASTFPDPSAHVPGTVQVELDFGENPHFISYSVVETASNEPIESFPAGSFVANKLQDLAYNSRVFYLDPGREYTFSIENTDFSTDRLGAGYTISSIRPDGEKDTLATGGPDSFSPEQVDFTVPPVDVRDREL